MVRIETQLASRGSQHWLQHYVNSSPTVLDEALGLGILEWRSPLAADDFAEYQDDAFLDRLDVSLPHRSLSSFWPPHGPVWDGLALTASGTCVLVEAKAHIPELFSSCGATSDRSIAMIRAALDETRANLGVDSRHDWTLGFYQYANRLAHAYLMNELNGVPTVLVFVDFIGDVDMRGPASRQEWEAAIEVLHEALGVRGKLPPYVRHAFVDVRNAEPAG